MLNLNPNDAVRYTPSQARAIDTLFANRGNRTGKELWDDKGTNDEFVVIKKTIMRHSLNIQRVRCVFCETLLEYGGVHIEHFAPKWKSPEFVYEPLNLSCSCPVCNGFMKKGKRLTIEGATVMPYQNNQFKYVHPYRDDVSREIRYRDPFHLYYDRDHCSQKGIRTIEMFHWDTIHARKKRFSNLLVRTTERSRRKMIAEILDYKG